MDETPECVASGTNRDALAQLLEHLRCEPDLAARSAAASSARANLRSLSRKGVRRQPHAQTHAVLAPLAEYVRRACRGRPTRASAIGRQLPRARHLRGRA